jgi:hypothetical protein
MPQIELRCLTILMAFSLSFISTVPLSGEKQKTHILFLSFQRWHKANLTNRHTLF